MGARAQGWVSVAQQIKPDKNSEASNGSGFMNSFSSQVIETQIKWKIVSGEGVPVSLEYGWAIIQRGWYPNQ